jgi:hypothetical protein
MVHHHQKAASCSALPSFASLNSISTASTQTTLLANDKRLGNQESDMSTLFPLPSFCIYSQRALLNEYAPESDIIQFLYPESTVLQERLPMLVGVFQSLFTVVNDMHSKGEDEDDDEPETDSDTEDDEDDDDEEELPFTIIGLNTMKLVIWNSMFNKDLSLVIFISSQLTDNDILDHMQRLKASILSNVPASIPASRCLYNRLCCVNVSFSFQLTASQIGDHINTSCKLCETFTCV